MRAAPSASLRALRGTTVALLALSVVTCHSEGTGPCTANRLAFTAQPGTLTAGSTFSVTVEAQDNAGNLVTCYSASVSIALGNAGGATLSGTLSTLAVRGVATFSGLSISKSGAGYTLLATSGTLTGGTSNAFAINAGPATALAFTTPPANAVAGAVIPVTVTARDQYGNTATSFTSVGVDIAIGTNAGSGTLSGTKTVQASLGVASFTNLSIDKVGTGYTLIASPSAGAPPAAVTSTGFNITPGAIFKLAFTVQPGNASAGSPFSVEVSGQDAQGNLTPLFSGTVDVAIGANPGSGTLGGTASKAAQQGKATFSDLTINRPGTGYTLTASSGSLTGATSATFNVAVGALAQLVFSTQPSTAKAGDSIAPAVKVTGQDAAGNTVTSFTGNVTVAFGNNAGSGLLGGTLTQTAALGVATFDDLSIDKTGTGYTLAARAGGVPEISSAPFDITPATAAKLTFSVQPQNSVAGTAIAPAVEVTALDQFDNLDTSFTGNVAVGIGTNPKSGKLTGTTSIGAAKGVATFSTLSIDSAGAGYTLTATASGVTDATSSTFNIRPGTATHLVFSQQPTNATAGVGIAPTVKVAALDAMGNVDTAYTATVNVAIGTNPGNGTLTGTAGLAAVAGVATFPGLSINKSGAGYTLTAASGALTGATSAGFNVRPGAATQLAFTVQPVNTAAGAAVTPSIKVAAQDALGNTDTSYTALVTLAIGFNAGGGALTGGGPVAAAAGVATFAASIDKVGNNYTLTASSGSLTGATSAQFNIFANTATHLVFNVQPTDAVAGVAMAQVVVHALDASNNVATGFTGGVTLSITSATGNPAATLSGTLSQPAFSGVATFSDLSINKTADNYTLDAVAGALPVATSGTFDITPAAATHLVFSVQPTSDTAGGAIAPAVVVQALDAFDNVDTAYTANVDVSFGTNPGTGTLSGTTPIAATHGQATFSNLSINRSGAGYTLHATSGTLTDATSASFDITAATLSQLVFTASPALNTAAGATIAPVAVQGQDALGNKVTTFAGDVTLAFGTNAGGGTLSGTLTQQAFTGDATFGNLSIDKAGQGYTLKASATGASDGTSAAFNIIAGTATKLVFTEQPAVSTTAHLSISPPIKVTAQDALGNTDSTFVGDVTMALGANPAGGVLQGTLPITAANGTATFSNLFIDKAGTGYALAATSGILTPGSSNTFTIVAAAATKLGFSVEPVTTVAGQSITPAVHVDAQDQFGNTDSTFAGNVGVAITGGTGKTGAVLTGGAAVPTSGGVAAFSGLSIDSAGTNYTLTATGGGLTLGTSAAFDINAGTVTQLVFGVQPTTAQAGAFINVTVVAKDAIGNINTGYPGTVTLSLPVNPGLATPNNNVAGFSSGVATFGSLFLDKTGTGYRLQGTDGSLTTAQSNAFDILPGAVHHLAFLQGPSNTPVNANITPAVAIAFEDAFNNIVTGLTSNVTVAIGQPGTGPGGGTLGGLLTRAANAGVATFPTLDINAVGTGYTLLANGGGLAQIESAPFNITTSTATQLIFTAQPANATAGTALPTMTVEIRDAAGQVVTSPNVNVTLAIKPGTGTDGATLSPTDPVTVLSSGGVATFSGISIDKAGSSYQLTASATSLTSANSKFFSIRPGTATTLQFTVQPSNAVAGQNIQPAVEVTALDGLGNADTSFHNNVSVAIGTNAGGGTLSGTQVVAPVKGIATFSTLNIDNQGSGYTLTATDGTLNATSNGFDITSALGNHLVFSVPPSNTTAGATISVGSGGVKVEVRDGSNQLATGFVGNVTLSITANTGTTGATLSGTLTKTVSSGVATFDNLSIDRSGTGYRLSAFVTGAAGVTSGTFAISAGAATQVVITTDASTTTAGQTMNTVVVTAKDAFGNVDQNFTGNVTVAISTNPGGGTLSGTTTVQANTGVANFTDLSINKSGTGYRLTATSGVLTSDVGNGFSINPGTATHLVFTVAPSTAVHDVAITPAIRVAAYDAFDNLATGFTNDISLAIQSGTQGASITGTTTRTPGTNSAPLGEARFDGLSINLLGTYTLVATATGVTQVISTSFNIIN